MASSAGKSKPAASFTSDTDAEVNYGKIKLVAIWEELTATENSKLRSGVEHRVTEDFKHALPKLFD